MSTVAVVYGKSFQQQDQTVTEDMPLPDDKDSLYGYSKTKVRRHAYTHTHTHTHARLKQTHNVCIPRHRTERTFAHTHTHTHTHLPAGRFVPHGCLQKQAERIVLAANGHVVKTVALRPGGILGGGDKVRAVYSRGRASRRFLTARKRDVVSRTLVCWHSFQAHI